MPDTGRQAPATAAGVTHAVVAQVWPLLALLTTFTAVAASWWGVSGDPVPARLFGGFLAITLIGLVGSFALHELTHLAALRQVPTVEEVVIERRGWRLSLHPRGRMSPLQVVGVAVAGPGACILVGLALWVLAPGSTLRWWYLAHALALVPPMGDGRAVVTAICSLRCRRPTARRP